MQGIIVLKLSLITERLGNPDLIPNYVWHPHGFYFLTWYNIPENLTGGRVPEYRFLYNSEKTYAKMIMYARLPIRGDIIQEEVLLLPRYLIFLRLIVVCNILWQRS